MNLKIIGTIDLIQPIEHKGRFKSLKFSIYTEQQNGSKKKYNYYGMQVNNNNVYWLTDYKKGDLVEIDFELEGKMWSGKIFNNCIVEKITMINDQGSKDYKRAQEGKKIYNREKPKFINVDIHGKK